MMTEEEIKDILQMFDDVIIPSAADWVFPKYNLSLKFHEVCTAIKVLKCVLNHNENEN